jgi:acetylornithine deacetylase
MNMIDGVIALPAAERALLAACDRLREQAVDHLSTLVSHRSILGHEQSCLQAMETLYRTIGLEPERVPIERSALETHPGWSPPLLPYEGREPVVATYCARKTLGRSLMLMGHIDVVPEGDAALWTSPPFLPTIRDGRMYGRGAADMKGGIVAATMALHAFSVAGLRPAANVYLAAVVEEECTGNGALAVMQAMPKPDACLIAEPGPDKAALYVAQVGVVWAWIIVTGRPTHVSDSQSGINAIEGAIAIAAAFKAYEIDLNRLDRRHPAFIDHPHPIAINLGSIEGGEWVSSVPTRARLGMRVGVMPGQSCRDVAMDITRLVEEVARTLPGINARVEFGGFMADGCTMPADQPISLVIQAAHYDVTGNHLAQLHAAGLSDARHYRLYQDTQATCYGTDSRNIHGIDESLSLVSLHEATRAIALIIARWCGVE